MDDDTGFTVMGISFLIGVSIFLCFATNEIGYKKGQSDCLNGKIKYYQTNEVVYKKIKGE